LTEALLVERFGKGKGGEGTGDGCEGGVVEESFSCSTSGRVDDVEEVGADSDSKALFVSAWTMRVVIFDNDEIAHEEQGVYDGVDHAHASSYYILRG
jgi:hypothetical protein